MTKKVSNSDLARVTGLSNRKAAESLGVSKDAVHLARTRALHGGTLPELPTVSKPKILAIDLETRPSLAYVWGFWNQNIGQNQVVEKTEVICFGARWLGEDNVEIRSVQIDGKKGMLDRAWELLNEADVVMGWNSQSFDVKHLNREFLLNGYTPPSPYAQIDLMRVCKSNFKMGRNSLNWVSEELGIGEKVQHEGFTLWTKCMAGDKDAWAKMYEYQKQDVDLLIDIYDRFLPWIKSHPNMALFADDASLCPSCGHTKLQENGVVNSGVSTFTRFICHKCGTWSRGTHRVNSTQIRNA